MKSKEAVSPVIAVILMVAITVVLAATVYVWVSGFGAGGEETPTITFDRTDGTDSSIFSVIESTEAGLLWSDFSLKVYNVTGGVAMTSTVTLPTGTTTVDAGDTFTVAKATTGGATAGIEDGNKYKITLVYTPTGGTAYSVEWVE